MHPFRPLPPVRRERLQRRRQRLRDVPRAVAPDHERKGNRAPDFHRDLVILERILQHREAGIRPGAERHPRRITLYKDALDTELRTQETQARGDEQTFHFRRMRAIAVAHLRMDRRDLEHGLDP